MKTLTLSKEEIEEVFQNFNKNIYDSRLTFLRHMALAYCDEREKNAALLLRVYMPGDWHCDKCGFEQHNRILNPNTGDCGAPRIEEVQICPNDGTVMRQVTWEECSRSNYEACCKYLDELDSLRAQLASAQERVKELEKQAEKDERMSLQIVDERDEAQEAISQAYYLVFGESPEWSNNFGLNQATEEIGDAVNALKIQLTTQAAQIEELRKERDALRVAFAEAPDDARSMGYDKDWLDGLEEMFKAIPDLQIRYFDDPDVDEIVNGDFGLGFNISSDGCQGKRNDTGASLRTAIHAALSASRNETEGKTE